MMVGITSGGGVGCGHAAWVVCKADGGGGHVVVEIGGGMGDIVQREGRISEGVVI